MLQRVISEARSPEYWEALFRWYTQKPEQRAARLHATGCHFLKRYASRFNLKFIPVTPVEFLIGERFLDKGEEVYPALFAEYVKMNSGDYVEILLTGAIGTAKALDVTTPIPTPTGWKLMGELQDGDRVYNEQGKSCSVLKAHPVMYGRPCYRITFDDGVQLVACEDHLWKVQSKSDRTNWKRIKTSHRVLSTKQLAEKVYIGKQANWSVDVAGPVEGPEVALGIDPYVLGYWLGDGTRETSSFSVAEQDVPSFVEQASRCYHVEVKNYGDRACPRVVVYGIRHSLRALGVLETKALPEKVFRASIEQRKAVLQGLLDSDGTVNKTQGTVTFTQVAEGLARSVYRLAVSLGYKARFSSRRGRYHGSEFTYHQVSFVPRRGDRVFRLDRKQRYVGGRDNGTRIRASERRYIVSIDPVESRPVRCITVDSSSRLYLAGESYVPTHNTTLALWNTAYQLYVLSAYKNPQREFQLESASEILFVFQSLNKSLATAVDFKRFRATIEKCRYFAEDFPFNKDYQSELQFPNRIIVKPISGESTGAIGQNVFGGMLDEVNFMQLVEESKQSSTGGEYDQAMELYNSIARRRKSRFMKEGRVPGLFCIVSSKRYPGQFTDKKEDEANDDIKRTGRSLIYVYDKVTWEVLPADRFSGKWFRMFLGDENRKPRIVEDESDPLWGSDEVDGRGKPLVIDIPVEYQGEFQRDPMNAIRDIAGRSTLALFPFFQSREDVAAMFGHHDSLLSANETDFVLPPLEIYPKRFWKPQIPRWVHIDLALRRDAAGVSCGCCPGFAAISRGEGYEDFEMMPQVRFDFNLRVVAPKGGEILFYKIRSLLYALRHQGLNIKWVSFDSFQSVDFQQQLRQNNFIAGEVSMDTSTLPYEMLKSACYDNRVLAPDNPFLEKEIVGLEMNPKEKKVDHPPTGSKDVADSMAGVVYGLTMRRETWVMYDVPIVRLPGELQALMDRERERMREAGQYDQMVSRDYPQNHRSRMADEREP